MSDKLQDEINEIQASIHEMQERLAILRLAKKQLEEQNTECGGAPHDWSYGRSQDTEWRTCTRCGQFSSQSC